MANKEIRGGEEEKEREKREQLGKKGGKVILCKYYCFIDR
jgi:hypothetical protein